MVKFIKGGGITFTVLDAHLDNVKIDDNKVILSENSYTILADNKKHTIVATDKAGNITTVTITVNSLHNYGTEWSSDDENHWHECIDADCPDRTGSRKDVAAHTASEWIIDKEATKEEEGSQHRECSICKKLLETKSIPKDIPSPSGNIIVTEPVIGEDAPHISVVGSENEIKEAVPLAEEEKAAVAAGSEIKIYLKIEKKTVTQEEKQVIDAAKEDYIIGEYIDVSMFKQIDGKEESPVRQLNKKIEISLVVPENLRNKNNNLTRIYAIIHHHSGEDKAEILQGVYDERTFSFTFTTDRFSTYTIVYKDTEKQTGNISYPIINGGGYATDFTQTSSPYPSVKPSAMPTAKPSQTPQTSTAPNTSAVPNASVVPTQEPVQDNVTPAPSQTPSDKMVNKDRLALNAGFKVSQTGNKIKILWGEVSGADGYDVYAQYCGKKFNSKPSNSVKSGKVTKVSIKKINGKKLNLKKSYKLYVAAYKLVNGKKIIMCKSIIAHNAGIKNKKYTNVKDIKVKKTSYTLKEGETAKINAITVLVDKKKKMLSDNHAKEFRYATSNREVAVVSSSGKIKATKKGSCIIYVYGKNGNTKKIKVKVK